MPNRKARDAFPGRERGKDRDRRRDLWTAGAAAASSPDRLAGIVVGLDAPQLPFMTEQEEAVADLWATGVSAEGHPTRFVRPHLDSLGVVTAAELRTAEAERNVAVAGVVTHRQRPATAGGTMFINLEDETGLINIVCSLGCWTRYRVVARRAPALLVRGRLERAEGWWTTIAHSIHTLPVAAANPSAISADSCRIPAESGDPVVTIPGIRPRLSGDRHAHPRFDVPGVPGDDGAGPLHPAEQEAPQDPHAVRARQRPHRLDVVACQGNVRFDAGSGGLNKMLKKAVTGEGVNVMQCTGTGELFVADMASEIQVFYLENDTISCNGASILAFSGSIEWDIQRIGGGMAGAMAGGMYNVTLRGTGYVAVTTKGDPVVLDVSGPPTFADPECGGVVDLGCPDEHQDRLRRPQVDGPWRHR